MRTGDKDNRITIAAGDVLCPRLAATSVCDRIDTIYRDRMTTNTLDRERVASGVFRAKTATLRDGRALRTSGVWRLVKRANQQTFTIASPCTRESMCVFDAQTGIHAYFSQSRSVCERARSLDVRISRVRGLSARRRCGAFRADLQHADTQC